MPALGEDRRKWNLTRVGKGRCPAGGGMAPPLLQERTGNVKMQVHTCKVEFLSDGFYFYL